VRRGGKGRGERGREVVPETISGLFSVEGKFQKKRKRKKILTI